MDESGFVEFEGVSLTGFRLACTSRFIIGASQRDNTVRANDESIDSAFARFNTIITSLKALDEEDSEIVKAKFKRKSLALKAKKESSDEEYCVGDIHGTTKRLSNEAETDKTAEVERKCLDAEIQIILLENVQSHRETRTKEHLLEVLGAIAVKKMIEKIQDGHVLVAQAH
ncbi:hypothetical protein Tco_0801830 [Tanacetum coccineum]|uniref:Uncharacterized protein n=1 Tax=Tanacetum coccineum TaxID=301880 RepID=A0ABQ4ZXW8_9ASTR